MHSCEALIAAYEACGNAKYLRRAQTLAHNICMRRADKAGGIIWEHMVDHQFSAWFRVLDASNTKYDDLKSPVGKTDYHTMGACYEVFAALNRPTTT